MYKQYNSRELFQILTPKAAVKFKHNSVGMVALTPRRRDRRPDAATARRRPSTAPTSRSPKSLPIEAKERATFGIDNRFAVAEPLPVDDFEAWNQTVNEDFDKLHQGKSTLPKPVQRLQPAVFDWAQRVRQPLRRVGLRRLLRLRLAAVLQRRLSLGLVAALLRRPLVQLQRLHVLGRRASPGAGSLTTSASGSGTASGAGIGFPARPSPRPGSIGRSSADIGPGGPGRCGIGACGITT